MWGGGGVCVCPNTNKQMELGVGADTINILKICLTNLGFFFFL